MRDGLEIVLHFLGSGVSCELVEIGISSETRKKPLPKVDLTATIDRVYKSCLSGRRARGAEQEQD